MDDAISFANFQDWHYHCKSRNTNEHWNYWSKKMKTSRSIWWSLGKRGNGVGIPVIVVICAPTLIRMGPPKVKNIFGKKQAWLMIFKGLVNLRNIFKCFRMGMGIRMGWSSTSTTTNHRSWFKKETWYILKFKAILTISRDKTTNKATWAVSEWIVSHNLSLFAHYWPINKVVHEIRRKYTSMFLYLNYSRSSHYDAFFIDSPNHANWRDSSIF